MICRCEKCEKQFDSKDGGYVMPKSQATSYLEEKIFCEECFTDLFQHEECGGFKSKMAAAVYDGSLCECD